MSMQLKRPELRFKDFKDDWKTGTLEKFGNFYYGKSTPKSSVTDDATTPCVRYGELYSTYTELISEIKSYTNLDPKNLKLSKGGEVLIPRVGENPLDFANCSYLPIKNVAIGEMISVYNTKENGLFFTFYIRGRLKKQFARVVEGGNVSNLYFRYLESIKVNIPSKEEQNKISSFLLEINKKIDQLTKNEKLLQEYKKGVMQKIFNREIRFKKDDGSPFTQWQDFKLSNFLVPTLREMLKPKDKYLAIGIRSHCKGTFQKPNSDPDKIAMDKLYLVKENDLIVNITFAWEGAIAIVKKEDENGLVSHRFPTYTFKETITNSYFFQYIIIQKKFRFMLDLISPGGAGRNRVMSKKDFLQLKWKLPCIEEQTKIVNFLSSIDSKIEKVQNQLQLTKEFKKGLLQRMFV